MNTLRKTFLKILLKKKLKSPAGALVLFVKKKKKKKKKKVTILFRLCVDYRKLNSIYYFEKIIQFLGYLI